MLDMQKIRRVQRSHCAEIGMSVLKDFRGQGVGRSLLLYALNWAGQRAIRRVELEVFATNTAAIKLYNAQGFVEEGRKIGAVSVEDRWVDLIQMVYSRVLQRSVIIWPENLTRKLKFGNRFCMNLHKTIGNIYDITVFPIMRK